jgi:hypothetical protein
MPELQTLRALTRNGRLLLLSRSLRLLAFGALAVVLVLYFVALGWSEAQIGRLLALTMVGDANLVLMALPLLPSLPLTIGALLIRGCLSLMDVPARQSYLMAVVTPNERSAAGGVTGLARSVASALAPPSLGCFLLPAGWAHPLSWLGCSRPDMTSHSGAVFGRSSRRRRNSRWSLRIVGSGQGK